MFEFYYIRLDPNNFTDLAPHTTHTCHTHTASDQPEHHLLQLGAASGAAGQEDHTAGVLLLLHPLPHGTITPKQGLP